MTLRAPFLTTLFAALLSMGLPAAAQGLPSAGDYERASSARLDGGEALVRLCVGETSARAVRSCSKLLMTGGWERSVRAEILSHRARHHTAMQRDRAAQSDRLRARALRAETTLVAGDDTAARRRLGE